MRRSDNSIVLTDVNVGELTSAGRWRERCATWTIRYAAEKLAAKYSIGTTVLFDLWTFANPKPNPNELLDADIWAADRLMGANISTQRAGSTTSAVRGSEGELLSGCERSRPEPTSGVTDGTKRSQISSANS